MAHVAKPALSPVDTSSPGDQANYEASSPTATSNAGSAWQDAAISRTPPPAAREARRSMSFAERSKANATTEAPTEAPRPGGAEPMPNEGNQVANVRASNARSSFATNKSQSFGGKLKSATGGAAAAARQLQERRKKQQRKVQGGKLLLMQLQEEAGAKEPAVMPAVLRAPPPDPRYTQPTFMSVLKSKMFGQPAVDPVNGRVEQGDPHKIKKSAGYKFRAAKRRAWQKNTGTSKRDDEDFNTLWGRVQRQEALLNLIQKDGKAYAKAIDAMHAAARTMAGHIAELTEMDPDEPLPDPGPISPGGTGPVSREAVVDRAARLTEVMDALENDVKPLCLEQLDSAVVAPVSQLVDDFPAYAPCVDKRRAYMLDVDAYERKLDKARTKSKDPGMAPHREEQYARAQRRFAHFSDKLVEDLTLLDANRFELAAFLLEGFIETQDFMMQRTRDVHSVIVKKSAD